MSKDINTLIAENDLKIIQVAHEVSTHLITDGKVDKAIRELDKLTVKGDMLESRRIIIGSGKASSEI